MTIYQLTVTTDPAEVFGGVDAELATATATTIAGAVTEVLDALDRHARDRRVHLTLTRDRRPAWNGSIDLSGQDADWATSTIRTIAIGIGGQLHWNQHHANWRPASADD